MPTDPPRRGGAPRRTGKPSAPRTGDAPRTGGSARTGGASRTGGTPRTGGTSRTGTGSASRTGGTPRTGSSSRTSNSSRTGGAPSGGAPRPARAPRVERPAGPPIPPDADPRLLPSEIRRELRALQDAVAERVAGHLVAAGMLLEEDAAAAYEHAKAAKALAQRVGAVREAVGVTAYHAGDYAAALAELKAARRITGQPDHLPLIADCERALGRPDRALAVTQDPERARLDRPSRVELAIVESGTRRDLGQPEAAVLALQGPELDSDAVEDWTVRLWYAYADALLAAGRRDDAVTWFTAAAAVDEDGETDAEERLVELSRPAGE